VYAVVLTRTITHDVDCLHVVSGRTVRSPNYIHEYITTPYLRQVLVTELSGTLCRPVPIYKAQYVFVWAPVSCVRGTWRPAVRREHTLRLFENKCWKRL
jgi:hypothetical protein